jgi:hypothetical protein
MSFTANTSQDQYHYSENGMPQGPISAQQLRQLAQAGRIQPQTLVWKEGYPGWVPAGSVKGLLPQITAVPPSAPPALAPPLLTPPPFEDLIRRPQARLGVLIGVIAGGVVVLGSLVVLLVILLNGNKNDTETDDSKKADPPKLVEKPDKSKKEEVVEKPPMDPPAPKPVEFAADDLLAKFGANPDQVLKDLAGKPVTLKIVGTWRVEDLEKCFDKAGNLVIAYYKGEFNIQTVKPNQFIRLIFPLGDPKSKLGFFAKIKEYAEKRKKGEKVEMSITGTLSTMKMRGLTFLELKDTVLD